MRSDTPSIFESAAREERRLNQRQRDVLDLIDKGHTNREIADKLGISLDGAKWNVSEILTTLGLSTREEAAEFWRWRRGGPLLWARRVARRMFSLPMLKWAAPVAGVGAGVAAVLTTIAWLGRAGDDGDLARANADPTAPAAASPAATALSQPVVAQPNLPPGPDGRGLKTWLAPGADLTQTIGVLDGDLGGNILLVDTATGLVMGKVEVGYGPWALFRRSASELLIAHQPLGPPGPDGGRKLLGGQSLAILDLKTLAVKREVELPRRSTYTTYATGMTMTADERYLFYSAIVQEPERPCTAAELAARPVGTDGHCDHPFVGTIDLEAATAVATLVEVPLVNCSIHLPFLVSGDAGYVLCIDGTTFEIAARNPSTIARVANRAPGLNETHRGVILLTSGADGSSGSLFGTGTFRLTRADGTEQLAPAVPAGASPSGFSVSRVFGDRIFVPYRRTGEQTMTGISVFDWRRGVIERNMTFDAALAVKVVDQSSAVVLLEDGSLERIDLQTGQRARLPAKLDLPLAQADFLP